MQVFDNKGGYALGYIIRDQWYIRPVSTLSKKPTFKLVVPLRNGDLRVKLQKQLLKNKLIHPNQIPSSLFILLDNIRSPKY